MATVFCRGYQILWIVCILNVYCIIPILSSAIYNNTTDISDIPQCALPLIETQHEKFYDDCGLFCDAEDAATPWTNHTANRNISILFLSLLIPALICNMIFTINNITEHRDNEETFSTTPITYDALFVWYFHLSHRLHFFFLLLLHNYNH